MRIIQQKPIKDALIVLGFAALALGLLVLVIATAVVVVIGSLWLMGLW